MNIFEHRATPDLAYVRHGNRIRAEGALGEFAHVA